MGLCASTEKEAHKTPKAGAQTAAPKVEAKAATLEAKPTSDSGTAVIEGDDEFRLVLRDAALMVLDNLAQTLEYEKEGFSEVAHKRGLKSCFEIMAPQHFEAVLKEYLEVGPVENSSLGASDPSFALDNFRNFLKACRTSNYKGTPSKATLAEAFQKACTATQSSLKACADAADASDLKLHLFFFINALNIIQGDIVGKPGLLFKNVDAFTSGGRVGDAPLPQ
jgi:hypothetical protein